MSVVAGLVVALRVSEEAKKTTSVVCPGVAVSCTKQLPTTQNF